MTEPYNAFTIRIPGPVSELRSPVRLSNPDFRSRIIDTMAVWDTGSPVCFISQTVMDALGLKFEGELNGQGFFGNGSTSLGLVSIRLVSSGRFIDVKACVVPDLHRGKSCQALIGMNVIGLGQLSLSFKDNIATFSFSLPAIDSGDLVDNVISKDIPLDFDYFDSADINITE